MSKAQVYWELNWDGKRRTRKAAWRQARKLMRAGKRVVLEQVWLWAPREGFPPGLDLPKRIHVGRWEYRGEGPKEIWCSYRYVNPKTQQAESGGGYGSYRKWMKSYANWM